MTKDVPTAPGDPSELFSPDDFEKGWRLHGALLDQALGSCREHRAECAGCPGIEADASNFSEAPLCRVGETPLSATQAAHRALARNAIERARGSFVGLSDGSVILVFKESRAQRLLNPTTETTLNWLDKDTEDHAFSVLLQYAAWGYDRVQAPGWAGEPNWKQVGRNLRFSGVTESARAAAAAPTRWQRRPRAANPTGRSRKHSCSTNCPSTSTAKMGRCGKSWNGIPRPLKLRSHSPGQSRPVSLTSGSSSRWPRSEMASSSRSWMAMSLELQLASWPSRHTTRGASGGCSTA